ncbi:hypothetical protein XM53_05045 [Roseovarius atlanticus]|uniref:Uncharacterized protein n=1 Tax=Roseovarius atlanticus TaxID=1641875 RepID=A0A0T5NYW4_9RHOB|nr:hypothetical protein XM53_05045 [Roseovarius atlanticus]
MAALGPLAGCDGTTLGTSGKPNVVQALSLYDGSVVVRGPRGYCIDADNIRRQPSNRLVFLGSCESLSGEPGVTVPLAFIVVNVAIREPGRTPPSAATIAASAAPKKPLAIVDGDGLALVHLDAGGELALPGGDPRYWRGGMVINDHLVSLAVYAPAGSSLAGASGRRFITDLARSLRRASAK